MSTVSAARFWSIVCLLLLCATSVLCARPVTSTDGHLNGALRSQRPSLIDRISTAWFGDGSKVEGKKECLSTSCKSSVANPETQVAVADVRLPSQNPSDSKPVESVPFQELTRTVNAQSLSVFQMLPRGGRRPPSGPSPGSNSEGGRRR